MAPDLIKIPRAREGKHVADVADARQVHDHALEAQAEAGVRQEP